MTNWRCLICGRPLPDFEPRYCCTGAECGCHGEPIDPPACSERCEGAVLSHIGHSYERRRELAGIDPWEEDTP